MERSTRLTRITPSILANAIPGTTSRWWERRMRRILALRDNSGRPIVVRCDRRYLGDLEALVNAILEGQLDESAA